MNKREGERYFKNPTNEVFVVEMMHPTMRIFRCLRGKYLNCFTKSSKTDPHSKASK